MKEIKIIEGYLIRLAHYKDNDEIATFLTREGLHTFRVRGGKKITSKNASSLLYLSYSSCMIENFNGLWTLKESKCLIVPPYNDDIKMMSSLSFILEICQKLISEDTAKESYNYLEATMEAINKGFSPINACLLLISKFIYLQGYGLNVDECIYCHKKTNINGIDLNEGGFTCSDEHSPNIIKLSGRKLKIIRYAFRYNLNDFNRVSFEDKECLEIINLLTDYLSICLNIRFKSLKALILSY